MSLVRSHSLALLAIVSMALAPLAARADSLSGVRVIPSCSGGGGGGTGWPGWISDWYEIYGSFSNNGNDVTVSVFCSFFNGAPPVVLSELGSNYRSSSQVNLNSGATNTSGTCSRQCSGNVYSGGVYLGSFSY